MKDIGKKAAIFVVAGAALFATIGSGSDAATSKSKDSGGAGNATSGDASEVADVTIKSCTVDADTGWPSAELSVTNGSSKASDYTIEVTFESKDGKTNFGTGNVFVQNLAAGQTKNDTAQGLDKASGDVTCKLTDVNRVESL